MAADAGALAARPLSWQRREWAALGAVTLGTALVYRYDADIRHAVQTHHNAGLQVFSEIGNPLGDGRVLLPALGLAALWGAHRDDAVLTGTAATAAEAALFAGGGAYLAKRLTGRARPDAGLGPRDWNGPGAGGDARQSFPSGHAAAAFAVAAVVAGRHPAAAVPAYGLAALTGYARLERDRHWGSDVAAGAALGLWIGHSLARRHPAGAPRVALMPLAGGTALTLTWNR